ncbi:MAG: polyprenyl synthetase family protein [Verrucomicrobiota bacterium]
MSDLKAYIAARRDEVDKALNEALPSEKTSPETLHKAMRHSMFAGGKRLRPILALAAAESCGGDLSPALPAACAVECLHTYSLIHDDLPCMDDDDFRRGVPTCHKVYGEDVAVLAGDALQAFAFELLANMDTPQRYPAAQFVSELAGAAGSLRLVKGQVLDMEGEGEEKQLTVDELREIHENKTGALLTASLRLGDMAANGSAQQLDALTIFGHSLGLAFQVIDDILDVTQSSEQLGKSAGKDEASGKSTYPALLGLDASKAEADRLTKEAVDALDVFGENAARLREIAAYMLERTH